MAKFPVEMVNGPEDGKRFVIHKDEMVLRFAQMKGQERFPSEDGPVQLTTITDIQYLRTRRLSRDGYRLYRFVPNG